MSRAWLYGGLGALFALTFVMCSLEKSGLLAGSNDGGVDGGSPIDCDPGAECDAFPGWTAVALAGGASSCPSGFVDETWVRDPKVGAGACACEGCVKATEPKCALGTFAIDPGTDAGCEPDASIAALPKGEGACVAFPDAGTISIAEHLRVPAPGVSEGACLGVDASTRPQFVSSESLRACVAEPACAARVCRAALPAGLRACLAREGEHACPAAFPTRSTVGAGTSLSCGACSAGAVTATCSPGVLRLYREGACAEPLGELPADYTCASVSFVDGGPGDQAASYRYSSEVLDGSVTLSCGTSQPTVALTGSRTLCCK